MSPATMGDAHGRTVTRGGSPRDVTIGRRSHAGWTPLAPVCITMKWLASLTIRASVLLVGERSRW